MRCPFCSADDTKVIDTRLVEDGNEVRRRRECNVCKARFTTFERADMRMPLIVKTNGNREPFNENKLRSGMLRALEKRPVKVTLIDEALSRIKNKLRALGEREVKSRIVGGYVMGELAKLDPVAYIRFASVYLSFENLKDFGLAIEKLEAERTKK